MAASSWFFDWHVVTCCYFVSSVVFAALAALDKEVLISLASVALAADILLEKAVCVWMCSATYLTAVKHYSHITCQCFTIGVCLPSDF